MWFSGVVFVRSKTTKQTFTKRRGIVVHVSNGLGHTINKHFLKTDCVNIQINKNNHNCIA